MATPAARSQSFPRSQKPALQREGFFSRLKRRLRIGSKGSYSVGESLEVTPASGQYVARSSTLESVQRLNRSDSDMGHHLVSSLVDGSESSESMVCVRSSPGACHPQRQATEKDSSAESLNKRKHQHKRSIRTEQLPALPSADKQTDSRNNSRSNHEAQRTGLAQSGEVVDNTFLLQEEKAIDLDDDVFKRDNPAPSMTGEEQRVAPAKVVEASRAGSGPDIPEDPGYETLEDQRVAPARVVGASRASSGPDIPEDPGYETLEDIRKQIQQEERQEEGGEKMKLEKENAFDPECFDDMGSGPGYETLDEIQKQVLEKRSEAGISVDCRLGSGAMTGQNSKTSLDSGLGSPDPQNGSPETLGGQSGSPETLVGQAGAGTNTCAARMVSSFHTVRSAQRSDMLNFYEAEDDIYANSQIPIRKKSVKKSQSEPNNVSGTEASGNNRCSVLSKPSAQNDVSGTDASGNNRCSVLSKPTTQNERCPSEKECSDVGNVASVASSDGGETMRELPGGGASPSTACPPPLPVRKYSRSDLEGFDCESLVISPDGKAASNVLGPCASSGSTPTCNTGFPIPSVQIKHANNLGSTKHEPAAEEKCVNREVVVSRESRLRNTEVEECTERTGSAVPRLQHTETAGSLLSPSNCPQSTNGRTCTDSMQRDRGTTVVQSACDGETKCRDCLVTDSDCVAGTRSGAPESPCDTESAQLHEGNPRTSTACVKTAFDGSLIPGSRLDSITRVKCRSNSRRGDKTEVEVCRGKVKLKGDIDGYVPLTSHIDTGKEDIDGRVPLASPHQIHTGNTGTNSYCSSPLRGLASSQHSPAAAGTSHAQGNSAQSSQAQGNSAQPRGNSAQSSQPQGNSALSSQPCAHRKQRAGGKDSNTKSPGCDALTSRLDSFTSEGTSCANGAHRNSGVTSAQVNTSVDRDTVCVSSLVDPRRETGTPGVCVSDDARRETGTPNACVSDDTRRETGTPNVCVSDDNDSIYAEYSSDAEPIHMSLREVFGDRDLPAQSPMVAGKKERSQIDTAAALAFQESMQQLKECGWYWGPLSHGEAETKLSNKPDGSFLVRDSANENYILTLSFRSSGKVYHTRIEHFKGKFGFWSQPESHGKTTIKDFIEQAMENSRNGVFKYFLRAQGPGLPPIAMHLLYPVSRFKTMRSLMHMCRFQVLQYVRRDHVDSLPIPARIKDYLREHQYYAEIIDDAVNDVVGFDDNANEVTQL